MARLTCMNTLKNSLHRLFTIIGIACLAWSVSAPVQAMTLREMRALEKSDKKQGDLYVRYYLVGVMEGAVEASAQAERAGGRPTLCLQGRRLEPSMARNLFDGELRRNKDQYEADMPVQLVMTQALAAAYPCE